MHQQRGEMSQSTTLTGIAATVGLILGVLNFVWALLKAYWDRPRLRIDVDWEWSDEDGRFPRIRVRNLGGRTVYIVRVDFVEANGAHSIIASLENHEIKVDQIFEFRPVWQSAVDDRRAEITTDDPEFNYSWKGLRVVVRDARGKNWRSRKPTTKPSWFHITRYAL
jgi:hypothetical protein